MSVHDIYFYFFLMIRPPPRSTLTKPPFPYTTLFRSKRRQFGYLAGSSQRNSPMPSERPFDRLPHMGIDRRPSRDFYHSLVASKRTIPAGTSAELPAVLFVRWEPWMIHPHGASSPL